jgi:uncharacterized protein with GYD domain
MPKYMFTANYVGDGISGLLEHGGSRRREAAVAAVESVGGTVECFYYTIGAADVLIICDVPDDASAVALSLTANATGAVRGNLTRLLTPADLDAAAAMTPAYQPPGT